MPNFFRFDGFIRSTRGVAVPKAQIFVCTQPVLTVPNPINAILPNPTPLQPIFSDPNGNNTISQPILADGQGHYNFYAVPGTYTVFVYLNNVLQQTYADQSIGLGFQTPPIVAQVNGVALSSATVINFTAGTQIVIVDNGGGTLQIRNLNPLATVFQTSPAWFSSTDGLVIKGPDPTVTPNLGTGTSQQIRFWMAELLWTVSISAIWVRISTGNGVGAIASFAIYDSTGTNKLVAWEGFDASTSNTTQHITFSPAKILQPGTYIMCCSANPNSAFAPTVLHGSRFAGSSETSAPYNQATARNGVAANSMSAAGVMPATLGTLTTSTASGTAPLFTFEP